MDLLDEETKREIKHLEDEFDKSVLINDDGTYKTSETQCVGNFLKHESCSFDKVSLKNIGKTICIVC